MPSDPALGELIQILASPSSSVMPGSWERVRSAALAEKVAIPVAARTGGDGPEWFLEQELAHQARLYWLKRVLRQIEGAGVTAVNLKGPVFGERYYDPPYGRPSSDLDLALAPGHIAAAVRALAAIGYEPEPIHFVALDQHVTLFHDEGPPVELHYRLLSDFGANQDVSKFLARARVVPVLGGARVPSPEDEFVFLCAHAAKHRFRPLRWMYDLFLFATRTAPDWDLVWQRAAEMRVRRLLALTAVVMRRDWSVDIPIPAPDRASAERVLPRFLSVSPQTRTGSFFWKRLAAGRDCDGAAQDAQAQPQSNSSSVSQKQDVPQSANTKIKSGT